MILTQKEAMVALLRGKILCRDGLHYRLNPDGELVVRTAHELVWRASTCSKGFEILPEWDLSFEDALADMRAGKICQCEIAPEFNYWMNDKGRIIAGEPTERLGPKANGHIVELCDDHFTARWRVAR